MMRAALCLMDTGLRRSLKGRIRNIGWEIHGKKNGFSAIISPNPQKTGISGYPKSEIFVDKSYKGLIQVILDLRNEGIPCRKFPPNALLSKLLAKDKQLSVEFPYPHRWHRGI